MEGSGFNEEQKTKAMEDFMKDNPDWKPPGQEGGGGIFGSIGYGEGQWAPGKYIGQAATAFSESDTGKYIKENIMTSENPTLDANEAQDLYHQSGGVTPK